jgi:hypothetical protein
MRLQFLQEDNPNMIFLSDVKKRTEKIPTGDGIIIKEQYSLLVQHCSTWRSKEAVQTADTDQVSQGVRRWSHLITTSSTDRSGWAIYNHRQSMDIEQPNMVDDPNMIKYKKVFFHDQQQVVRPIIIMGNPWLEFRSGV